MKINTDVLPVLVLLWSSWLHIKGTRISGKKIKWQHSGCYWTAREKHWLEIECIPNNCLEMLYFLNNYFMKVEKRDCRYKQLYQILMVNLIPSKSRVNSHSFDTKFHCYNPMVTGSMVPLLQSQSTKAIFTQLAPSHKFMYMYMYMYSTVWLQHETTILLFKQLQERIRDHWSCLLS